MPFTLTSQQYGKIDAVAQVLTPLQRHPFLLKLAGKIALHARVTRSRTVADADLARLVDETLCEIRVGSHQNQQEPLRDRQPSGEDCVEATAKELDRLIASIPTP